MKFPAHIRFDANHEAVEQTVEAHCRASAQHAQAVSCLPNTAYLAGLLHDFGKYTHVFEEYIRKAAWGENVRRGSVNHTFAGVRFAFERWHKPGPASYSNIACELIAFAIGAHHGLFDCIDSDGRSGFIHRLTKEGTYYEEAKAAFLENCASLDELDKFFDLAAKEVTAFIESIKPYAKSNEEMMFYLSLVGRMLGHGGVRGRR